MMASKEIILILVAIYGASIDCRSTKSLQPKYTIKFGAVSKDFCLNNDTSKCHDRCASVGYTDEWFCDVTGSDSFCNCKLFDPASADAASDSPWHMTIGGYNGAYLSSVELYNWKTGQQCFIDPLPQGIGGHSGTLMNGDPVVCGGANQAEFKADCYHYQRDTKKWEKINDLMTGTSYAASIQIPGKGWYLFGGNYLETSQKLVNISSNWEAGPAVQTPGIWGQCAVQINETVTAFLGGDEGNYRNIYTLDWTSQNPTFILQNEKLVRDRYYSTCELISGKDGLPVVAIIGGLFSTQRGMEIWNPRLKTVELLLDVIPPEEGGTDGLAGSEMVVLKDGKEILLYGGDQGSSQDGIWKYMSINNTWERVGNLLEKKDFHVTLPVSGMECP